MSENPRHKHAGQPPVSAHPAFPVIVALWFAALLGIGSMVLPIDLFERFAVASGLAEVYQAAQPPLGATARIFVAIAAAAIGAVAGVLISRRIAASNRPKAAPRRAAALRTAGENPTLFAKRPISAHEELGEGGLDADAHADAEPAAPREPFAGRRRALAVTEESAPSEFLDFAPLPGQVAAAAFDEPLDLVAFDAPGPDPDLAEESDAVQAPEPEPEPAQDSPAIAVTFSEFGTAALSAPPTAFHAAASTNGEIGPFGRREESTQGTSDAPPAAAVAPLAERALGDLGIVELVERFALALQRHREEADRPVESMVTEPVFHTAPDVAEAGSAVFAAPAEHPMPQVSAIPDALRPVGFGFEEDDDDADAPPLDLSVALSQGRGPFAAPTLTAVSADEPAQEAADDDDEDLEGVAEEEYTSLLAMKSPVGLSREPVRIEDDDAEEEDHPGTEPVVIFPGQAARRASPATEGTSRDAIAVAGGPARPFDAPLARAEQAAAHAQFSPARARNSADSGATERALRDALEKLQKMSGAA